MRSSSLYINECTFASGVLRFVSCCAAIAVMTTDKRRGKLLPQCFSISLPFPFASLFLVSNGTRYTDLLCVPSVNILYPAQLLNQRHGYEASLSLLFEDRWSPAEFDTRLCLLRRPHVRMVWFL